MQYGPVEDLYMPEIAYLDTESGKPVKKGPLRSVDDIIMDEADRLKAVFGAIV